MKTKNTGVENKAPVITGDSNMQTESVNIIILLKLYQQIS